MKLRTLCLLPFILSTLAGCGTVTSHTTRVSSSVSQFKDLTNTDVSPPDKNFDPSAVTDPQTFKSLSVLNSSGKTVSLSVKNSPILFVAYWCPHCQRTLSLLSKNYNSLGLKPTIVYIDFGSNETLKQAKATSKAELSHFNYPDKKVYYILSSTPYIKGIPDLIVSNNGTTYSFAGEHVLSTWKKALA